MFSASWWVEIGSLRTDAQIANKQDRKTRTKRARIQGDHHEL
jgi:hypothetical protein